MFARTDNTRSKSKYDGLRAGVLLGIKVAVFFSVIALAAFLIGGNAALEVKGNPPIQKLLLVYILGGVLAGAIAGALSEFVSSDLRAALVGFLAILPAGFIWRLAKYGFSPWRSSDTVTELVIATIFGAGGGIITRKVILERRNEGARSDPPQ